MHSSGEDHLEALALHRDIVVRFAHDELVEYLKERSPITTDMDPRQALRAIRPMDLLAASNIPTARISSAVDTSSLDVSSAIAEMALDVIDGYFTEQFPPTEEQADDD